ncbi:D-alanyl-D-alanine carboxypeptidase [Celeribacter baekdonensis]|uniref:D-alanyl-D-alanine carboxypeptidase n=1 Tax=Celeribacter baekdonensis TaxID=875171 RepID=UPI0020C799E7|nr:D-alanyl-D-alanine carboxypeptidase [Celeribacter baekdonensis]
MFQTVAAQLGLRLPQAQLANTVPEAAEIARLESAPMSLIVKDMLKYSTNLTAEVLGLLTTQARGVNPVSLHASAQAMTDWARERFGLRHMSFVDHSGLGGASKISVSDMVHMLTTPGVEATLAPLLKPIPMKDAKGEVIKNAPASVVAKTGTLDFVSTLAGYLEAPGGTRMAFAIFAADVPKREAAKLSGEEVPQGARSFNAGAKKLQQSLIARWATAYQS